MTDTRKNEVLIVGAAPSALTNDRGGGQLHSLPFGGNTARVALDRLERSLTERLAQVADTLSAAANVGFAPWTLAEIKLGLAITAEGDIGIVAAGAEASIELTFTRADVKPSA